jgi:glycosyltransferase involved in cell wall biosynthesis
MARSPADPGRRGAAPRIALVHDWLTGMRGGEKVLEALVALCPSASLFTLFHVRGSVSPAIEALGPRVSALQHLPAAARRYREYLPLFPAAVELFDLDAFDLVVSSSHCAAKAVVKTGRARHLCYCHTPMRYGWDQFPAYFGADRIGRLPSLSMRAVMRRLARWDRDTAPRVDRFVANSCHVAQRIRRYYNREAFVVHPPVETDFFQPDGSSPGAYFLIVSALVPYKRLEVAIAACGAAGVRLRIAGQGPELGRLRRQSGARVEFLEYQSDDQLRALYRGCAALLMPGEEDFGIVPVEAQACGRPVVALARGGALETVIDGVTGVLVADDSAEAFAEGIRRVRGRAFDPGVIQAHAARFSRSRFMAEMAVHIEQLIDAPPEPARC